LQVVWQRVMSLHAGVDLVSFTTVVSAFLAGLGLGSLLGGSLADRLGPRRAVLAFAASNLTIGVFAWISLWLFYDVYRAQAEHLGSTPAKFLFNFALLLVPTVLMGLSLPLAARSLVARAGDAGTLVGRLYAVNTLGASAGAAVAGWWFLGTFGFTTSTRIAGTLNVLAAVVLLLASRSSRSARAPATGDAAAGATEADAAVDRDRRPVLFGGRVWPWYLLYGLTGAVALGFEVVFFRVIDTAMRSNSYSFPHVLSLYLLLFGLGAALATPIVRRTRRPDLWFLWVQFAVGVTALLGVILLVRGVPHSPFADTAAEHFAGEGLAVGFTGTDGGLRPEVWLVFVGFPLLVMAAPVLCMGMAFPFVEALVSDRLDTLGRHTGRLLFANIVGNVAGTLIVGFWMLDRMGTSRTYRLLGLALLIPGLAAAWGASRPSRRVLYGVGAIVLMLGVVAVVPNNPALYASLHGVAPGEVTIAEDRTCVAGLRQKPDGVRELTINGSPQNNYPFDDFHVLIGLTPAIVHPAPEDAMALGLGIGATPYGLGLDPRLQQIATVEICGGEIPLLDGLRREQKPELQRLLENPRQQLHVGDGRDFLLRSGEPFDIVVVDTLRPQSAFSGSLYSTEFYELVRSRLAPGGVMAQWLPTPRVENSVTDVFPYVMTFKVWSYFGSTYALASDRPLTFDRAAVLARLQEIAASPGLGQLEREQLERMQEFFRTVEVGCLADGGEQPATPDDRRNHDLHPRDEYFLNNPPQVPGPQTCG
jgi:spermidine synthase